MTKLSKDLEEAAAKFDQFDKKISECDLGSLPKPKETELQSDVLKISQKEKEKNGDVYLKPIKTIGCREKFNETHREDYNYAKELVRFEAENVEIIGEAIDIWTRPFPGMPAEEWVVPTNTPVWGPRYLAEQLTKASYRRLKMDEKTQNQMGSDGHGSYYSSIIVDTTIQRLNARPAVDRKSVFMGARGF